MSAFKAMAPPITLGRWGVALGLEYMTFTLDEHADAWNDTFTHPDAYHELGSHKAFPKARVRVGVSDRLDLGAYYTRNPNANYGWVGVEAKHGLMRQSETMPISLAVRGAYTKTLYVDDMDMHAITVDIGAGRTFWNALTPYLDVGGDLVMARETSAAVDLRRETLLVSQLVGGVEYRLWHVALGAEVNVAALTTFQLKVVGLF